MTFNPEEWRKLSERQRQAIIRKIEREEKRAKTAIVVIILVFAFLLFLFAVMSSCPTPQDATPTGQGDETQAQYKPSLGAFSGAARLLRRLLACAFKSSATHSPSLVM